MGTQQNPPSFHAMQKLRAAIRDPFPAQEVNFTVRDKLVSWGYVTLEPRQSPYKTHKLGKTVNFLVSTELGRKAAQD